MPRITKGMIDAAHRELVCIGELYAESGHSIACLEYHAVSGCRHLETLAKAGRPELVPDWLTRENPLFLKAHGWRGPFGK